MGKLKSATCPICNKPIGRHDPDRIEVRLLKAGKLNPNPPKIVYHLKCYQETGQ